MKTIKVTGSEFYINEDDLRLLFGSKKRNNGGKINRISINDATSASITFEDDRVADTLVEQGQLVLPRGVIQINKSDLDLRTSLTSPSSRRVTLGGPLAQYDSDWLCKVVESMALDDEYEVEEININDKNSATVTFAKPEGARASIRKSTFAYKGDQFSFIDPENNNNNNNKDDYDKHISDSKARPILQPDVAPKPTPSATPRPAPRPPSKPKQTPFHRSAPKPPPKPASLKSETNKRLPAQRSLSPRVKSKQDEIVYCRVIAKCKTIHRSPEEIANHVTNGDQIFHSAYLGPCLGEIVIVFDTAQDVGDVLKVPTKSLDGHLIELKQLDFGDDLEIADAALRDPRRIYIESQRHLEENVVGEEIAKLAGVTVNDLTFIYTPVAHSAIVEFKTDIDVPDVARKCRLQLLGKTCLKVRCLPSPNRIQVSGFGQELGTKPERLLQLSIQQTFNCEVDDVELHEDIALITIKDPNVVNRAVEMKHYRESGVLLKIHLYNHYTGFFPLEFDPSKQVPRLPHPVRFPDMNPNLAKHINENQLVRGCINEALTPLAADLGVVHGTDEVQVVCVASLTTADFQEVLSGWKNSVKALMNDFISDIVVKDMDIQKEAWLRTMDRIHQYIEAHPNMSVFPQESTHRIILVGNKREVKECMDMKIRQSIRGTQQRIDLSWGQRELMKRKRLVFSLKRKYPELEINLDSSGISGIGSVENVLSFNSDINSFVFSIASTDIKIKKETEHFLNSVTLQRYMTACEEKGIAVAARIDDCQVNVWYIDSSSDQCVTLFWDTYVERTYPVPPQCAAAVSSDIWSAFELRMQERYNYEVLLSRSLDNTHIHIAATSDIVNDVRTQLNNYLDDHAKVDERFCPMSESQRLLLEKYAQNELAAIQQQRCVELQVMSGRGQGFYVTGSPEATRLAIEDLSRLVSSIKQDSLLLTKAGMTWFFRQHHGKLLLKSISDKHNVIIADDAQITSLLPGDRVAFKNKNIQIVVLLDDITTQKVDAMVNAANENLNHVGGVALALLEKGGQIIKQESEDYIAKNGTLQTSDVAVTSGGSLPCKHVIHAVGPRWKKGSFKIGQLLRDTIRNILNKAQTLNCQSVAMPVISCGVFGFPAEQAAIQISGAIASFISTNPKGPLKEILIVDKSSHTCQALINSLRECSSQIELKNESDKKTDNQRNPSTSLEASELRQENHTEPNSKLPLSEEKPKVNDQKQVNMSKMGGQRVLPLLPHVATTLKPASRQDLNPPPKPASRQDFSPPPKPASRQDLSPPPKPASRQDLNPPPKPALRYTCKQRVLPSTPPAATATHEDRDETKPSLPKAAPRRKASIKQRQTKFGTMINIVKGSMIEQTAEVLCIMANGRMDLSSTVTSSVVLSAAGNSIQKEVDQFLKGSTAKEKTLPSGCFAIAKSGKLKSCRNIYVGVLDRWADFKKEEKATRDMERLILSWLNAASSTQTKSIALVPAGREFDFPEDLVAKALVEMIEAFGQRNPKTTLKNVSIVIPADDFDMIQVMEDELKTLAPMKPPRVKVQEPDLKPKIETRVFEGDILKQGANIICSLISSDLQLSTYPSTRSLLAAAGDGINAELSKLPKPAKPGTYLTTSGGKLIFNYIYYGVLNKWDKGKGDSNKMLESIVKGWLGQATCDGYSTIAMPPMGTEKLRYPAHVVAKIMRDAVNTFSLEHPHSSVKQVLFVIPPGDKVTLKAFGTYEYNEEKGATNDEKNPDEESHFGGEMLFGSLRMQVLKGDITEDTADAIVNSTTRDLDLTYPLSRAIVQAGGDEIINECKRIGNTTDDIAVTTAGKLPSRYIIHVNGMAAEDKDDWSKLVRKVLKEAERKKFDSLTFPALGTGKQGVPPNLMAEQLIQTLSNFVDDHPNMHLGLVRILLKKDSLISIYHDQMINAVRKNIGVIARLKRGMRKLKGRIKSSAQQDPLGGLASASKQVLLLTITGFESKKIKAAKEEIGTSFNQECQTEIIGGAEDERMASVIKKLDDSQRETIRKLKCLSSISIVIKDSEINLYGPSVLIGKASKEVASYLFRKSAAIITDQRLKGIENLMHWEYWREEDGEWIPYNSLENATMLEAYIEQKPEVILKNQKTVSGDIVQKQINFLRQKETTIGSCQATSIRLVKEGAYELPSNWSPMKGKTKLRVEISKDSKEYEDVMESFEKTSDSGHIIKIERVQNPELYQQYMIRKQKMKERLPGIPIEQHLFHGASPKAINNICDGYFNRSYGGKNAMKFGNGVYFATGASYSEKYSHESDEDGYHYMFRASVLTGVYTQGEQGMIEAPAHSDSTVDDVNFPEVFVVYSDTSAYPSHIITYSSDAHGDEN